MAWFLPDDIAMRDASLLNDTQNAMKFYFLGYILLGVNIVSAIFFQSIQRTLSSFIIAFSYTLLFALCFVMIFPKMYGFNGVILSYPMGTLCATFVAFGIILYEYQRGILKK